MNSLKITRFLCCGIDVHKSFIEAVVAATDRTTLITEYTQKRFSTFKETQRISQTGCGDSRVTRSVWSPPENTGSPYTTSPRSAGAKSCSRIRSTRSRSQVKKTDKRDARWIAECFMYDLVRGSFIPEKDIRELRDFLRYRAKITNQSSSEKNRLRELLTVGNVKLDDVFTDITGKSSSGLIEALMEHPDGDIDVTPYLQRRGRPAKASPDQIQAALKGSLDPETVCKMRVILGRINAAADDKASLDAVVAGIAEKYKPLLDLLQTIPGVKTYTALTILSEIGPDMTRVNSVKSFVSWAGLVPQNNESGGKRKTTRISHAGANLKPALVQWANAVSRSKKYPEIAEYYRRVSLRRGHKKAIIALCRKIMTIVYRMLSDMTPYDPTKFSGHTASPSGTDRQARSVAEAISLLSSLGLTVCDDEGVVYRPGGRPFEETGQ